MAEQTEPMVELMELGGQLIRVPESMKAKVDAWLEGIQPRIFEMPKPVPEPEEIQELAKLELELKTARTFLEALEAKGTPKEAQKQLSFHEAENEWQEVWNKLVAFRGGGFYAPLFSSSSQLDGEISASRHRPAIVQTEEKEIHEHNPSRTG